jgi:peptide deformylase
LAGSVTAAMILPIVKYGHPVLRQKGARIEKITPEIARLIADMLETMYDGNGLGLAAQQVGQALQLTVLDVRGAKNRPSTLRVNGQSVDVEKFMPLVLINPETEPAADPVEGTEGCLSFPELFAEISRPESIEVTALNQDGNPVTFCCGGLLARAVQHEKDHLQGILFIDRMSKDTRRELQSKLDELQAATKADLKKD